MVLCNRDAGYPNSAHPSSPGRGTWSDNIANTRTTSFLQASNTHYHLRGDHNASDKYGDHRYPTWRWPAVVLVPEEYKLRVGGMSITELQSHLEEYWGWGGIPGADNDEYCYQDMWVYAWAPDYPAVRSFKPAHDPYNLLWKRTQKQPARLDRAMFSRWVDRECAQWLDYFISENHTLGVVHAWFTAFLGVTRESLVDLAKAFADIARHQDPESEAFIESIHRLKIRMSFDVCIKGYDEAVDGIPSLPSDTQITTNEQGMHVINNSINNMFPRRIWDICANTVIPATWFCGPPCPLTGRREVGTLGVKPISHAWVADRDLTFIMTEANQHMWPVPLPRGVLLEDVRGEMIRLGVRYAWLDVLCLRQQTQPTLAKDLAIPASMEAAKCMPVSTEVMKSIPVNMGVVDSILANMEGESIPVSMEVVESIPPNMEVVGGMPVRTKLVEGIPADMEVVDIIPVSMEGVESIPPSTEVVGGLLVSMEVVDSIPISIEVVDSIPPSTEVVGNIPVNKEVVESIPVSTEAVGSTPASTEVRENVLPSTEVAETTPSSTEVVESVPLRTEAVRSTLASAMVMIRREQRRLEEWKIDVPTIGAIYSNPDKDGLYGGGPTVVFMSGLGRPFQDEGWASERHWLRRAWTLQESPLLSRCLIAGLPIGPDYQWFNQHHSGGKWPWNCKVCNILSPSSWH